MATFDPLHAARNAEPPSEYGGSGPVGVLQPKSLGHNLDAPDHVQEKAFIVRFEGKRSAQVMEDLPVTDEHYDAVAELQALRAERLGEYDISDAL
jgi:hypothetical protein